MGCNTALCKKVKEIEIQLERKRAERGSLWTVLDVNRSADSVQVNAPNATLTLKSLAVSPWESQEATIKKVIAKFMDDPKTQSYDCAKKAEPTLSSTSHP